jgi:hypothetical protein
VTDLFVEGRELVVRSEPDPVLVWVNKLNSFEMDDARKDGAVARARFILALKEIGSPEKDLFEASLADATVENLREALVNGQQGKWWVNATNAVRVDSEWAERYQMVERAPDSLEGPEKELMVKVRSEYLEELQKRVDGYQADYQMEIAGLDLDKLKDAHREVWAANQGLTSFSREYRRAQVFYAMRVCSAAVCTDGRWDHGPCDHTKHLCDTRDDVANIPDELTGKVLGLLQDLETNSDDARFSAGAASSSAPSPRPSSEEASVPSGPEVTSAEPATTSS